ncbi:MAG: IclR family transcriptional regulator [Sulfitobacter sp.]
MNDAALPPSPDDETDRQFVNALARGLDILSCFGNDERYLSNNEISARTGLARPTVSRLTYTLMKTGHLLRHEDSGTYRLSAKVLHLGFSALSAMNIGDRCADILAELVHGPNQYVTAALAERAGSRAVYLARRRSKQAVSLSLEVGARLPLFYSGVGRAILAGMADKDRQEAFRLAVAEFPEQKQQMADSLVQGLQDFETYGYCTSFGTWKPEINAIAVPVRSLDGETIYGLNVGGPSFLISPEELHAKYGERLLDAARALTGRA